MEEKVRTDTLREQVKMYKDEIFSPSVEKVSPQVFASFLEVQAELITDDTEYSEIYHNMSQQLRSRGNVSLANIEMLGHVVNAYFLYDVNSRFGRDYASADKVKGKLFEFANDQLDASLQGAGVIDLTKIAAERAQLDSILKID